MPPFLYSCDVLFISTMIMEALELTRRVYDNTGKGIGERKAICDLGK